MRREWDAEDLIACWHVDRRSARIYSQLKACSASEVAAMIEGLLAAADQG